MFRSYYEYGQLYKSISVLQNKKQIKSSLIASLNGGIQGHLKCWEKMLHALIAYQGWGLPNEFVALL